MRVLKTNLRLSLLVCVIFPLAVAAQKYEPGRVTIEQLQQKQHPSDSSASAAVLHKIGQTTLEYRGGEGFTMVTKCYTRIKIYKKEGYEWANASVPFYTDRESEKVSFSDAVTYNLVNGKIEKTKLKSDGEFTEKSSKFWSRKKIAMPNVKEGSIVEYSYQISSPYFQNMPDWSFQEAIPVDYAEFKTGIPQYFGYQVHLKGSLKPVTETVGHTQHFEGKNRVRSKRTGLMEDEFYEIDFNQAETTYKLRDIPALREEAYVNNISNYTSSLEHELASYQAPGGAITSYTADWESVVRTIYNNEDFGGELSKNGYFESDLRVAMGNTMDQQSKIAAVYTYVRNDMNWNGYYGYYCDKGVKKAYQEKTGNVAEINLILTAMLKGAGFLAHPVLVSTRSNGVSVYPALSSFNYVVAAVEMDGRTILLDATDKYAWLDILPARDLNWFGRIVRPDGTSQMIDLMPKNKSRQIVNVMAAIDTQGKLKGQLKKQYYDYNAMMFLSSNGKLSDETYLEKMEKVFDGMSIEGYKREAASDASKMVSESYGFEQNGTAEVIGDRMYISPISFLTSTDNPFKREAREYPIDFLYPRQEKYNISLAIPDGYAVESVPSPVNLSLPDSYGVFKYVLQAKDNSLQIAVNYEMNEAIVPADYYSALRDFYKQMTDKQNEKIVLKKI